MSAIVSAIVLVLFAPGLFVAGYMTRFIVEEDEEAPAVVVQPTPVGTPAVQATPTPLPVVENVSTDDDASVGPEDAPVTIVEFTDYQ